MLGRWCAAGAALIFLAAASARPPQTQTPASPAPGAPAPAEPTFVVRGVMLREMTQERLKHVFVTIQATDVPGRQLTLETSDDGQFTFSNVPAGKYNLSAELRGVSRSYQADGNYSTGIAVGPNIDSEHIVFPLPAPTSLSVKVIDADGEPVRNCQLHLFHKLVLNGWYKTVQIGAGNAASSSGHRFSHLEPGIYLVAADARPWYAQNSFLFAGQQAPPGAGNAELDMAYPVTYFGNTPDPEQAAPIVLAEGESREVQIVLHAVKAAHLDLAENDSETNPAARVGLSANLMAIGPAGIPFQISTSMGGTSGHLEVDGIAPGRYALSLSRYDQQPNHRNRISSSGSRVIDVSGDTSLPAEETPATSVSGQAFLEDKSELESLGIWLENLNTGQRAFGTVAKDGTFQLHAGYGGIMPGRYQMRLAGDDQFYVKSFTARNADVSGGIIDLRAGAAVQLSVAVAKGLSNINGVVLKQGRPAAAAMVLLVPSDKDRGLSMPRDQSDSDGTFTLRSVPPGHYLAVAIDHGHNLAYQEPDVLRPYLSHAVALDVPLSANGPVLVNLQRRVP